MHSADDMSLYLHIGHAKAGSTSIQTFLYENWRALREQSVIQPAADLSISSDGNPPANPLNALIQQSKAGSMAKVADWIAEVRRTAHGPAKLVLSSEYLFNPGNAALFRKIAEQIPVHLVYYIRRQDEQLIALWRQWALKSGIGLNEIIEKRIAQLRPNYRKVMKEWRGSVKLASWHVRYMAPAFLEGGNLISDFASAIGVGTAGLVLPGRKNPSLDGRLLHFMSRHADILEGQKPDAFLRLLMDPNEPLQRTKLTQAQFTEVHDRFEWQNRRMLEEYHAEMVGTKVLEEATAPIITAADKLDIASQHAYMAAQLSRLAGHTDPRLQTLQERLEAEVKG